MRKLFVLLGVGALVAMSFAQTAGPKGGGPQGPGKGGQERMRGGMMGGKRIFDQLNLTAAQKTKMEALREKMRADMKANFEKGSKPDAAKVKAAMDKYQKDIMAILTPAQQTKYKALLEEMKAKRGQGGPGGPGGANKVKAGAGGAKKGGGGQ
ncbi:MAG: Spy/CpxP family protein refolding chaperone [Fimbriimonadaceae bacterium]|nr:Spy/CpxP family protein refolding chaperone [Fimbriimonadaceae bacterium]